jgi:hypothetical protein
MRGHSRQVARRALTLLLVALLAAPGLRADRTPLKPGMNFFKPEEDIKLGQDAAREAEQQLPLLKNAQVDEYLNQVGKRLARHAPGFKFPYSFKAVNQSEINAFALPGGFLYVNRGTIEAAKNEAELAGVMAHEISHAALRHGTNQLSKAMLAQAPLMVLGGFAGGSGGAVGALAQLGIEVGFASVFLKFSRTAETQADVLGTQMLFDARYEPAAMANFFDTLTREHKSRSIEFFSSHPNPDNRQKRIQEEIAKLGPLENPRKDSEEFHVIKRMLKAMPPPPKPGERQAEEKLGRQKEPPSETFQTYRHDRFVIQYPDNWEVKEAGTHVTLAPRGGAGENAVAYGVIANVLDLDDPRMSLEDATEHLVQLMIQNNPGMKEIGHQGARVGGRRAIATELRGRSPVPNQRETDWLFTVHLGDSLFYAVFITPEPDYRSYQRTFQVMLDSVRFR